jgi:hypothetical protein
MLVIVSIVQSLKKLVDPERARQEAAQFKRERELPRREAAGDPPTYCCRICQTTSTDRSYCPACLADTMVPLARER